MKIGTRLILLRKTNNISKKEMSNYLNLNEETLTKIENNERSLTSSILTKLCELYNCSEEYLLKGDGKAPENLINEKINLNTIATMNRIIDNLKHLHELNAN